VPARAPSALTSKSAATLTQVQALGVAAAPRELQETSARRTRDPHRAGQPLLVEAVQLAHPRGCAERSLCAWVVEASHRLQPDGRARDPSGYLEAQRQCGQERRTIEALPLAHRQHRR
jgi:hypothetical protein